MKSKSRREFVATALAGATLLVPRSLLAAGHPRAVDLVITRFEWSADQGLTWNPEEEPPPPPETPILFRVAVKNQGLAAARINTPLEVAVKVNGETVALSNHHRAGLSPGSEVVLETNTGPMGDGYWYDSKPGTQAVQVVVDPQNLFHSESSEDSRSTEILLEFDITDALGIVGAVIGGMIGGPAGAFGGAFVGGFVGGFVGSFRGELAPNDMIGWSEKSGGGSGGGYFPRQVSSILIDWGAPSLETFVDTLRRFGGTSVVALRSKHWKAPNPDIWGDPGAINDMKGVRKVVLAYAWLHRTQMASEGNTDELKDLRLYGDGFFDQEGRPTPKGGRATNLGCGVENYYGDLCATLDRPSSYRTKVQNVADWHGFRSTKVQGWRQGLIPMHHASVLNVPDNLQPNPSNGGRGEHGLRRSVRHIIELQEGFKRRTKFSDWTRYGAQRAKVHHIATPLYLAALAQFVRLVVKYALSPRDIKGKSQAREELAGWWAEEGLPFEAMGHMSDILDDFLFGTGMEPIHIEDVAFKFLDQMAAGDPIARPPLPRISVSSQVYSLVSRQVFPESQRRHFQDALYYHSKWRRGLLKNRLYVRSGKIVGD